MKLFNKKYIYVAFIAAMTMSATSCDDMLDKTPPSEISDGNFWMGEGDAQLALNACYRFASGWANDTFDGPQGLMYMDLCGGHGSEKEGFTYDMAGAHTTSTNDHVRYFWENCYNRIAKYNTFLDNVVDCPMDETLKTQMISEVKVLRSYFFLKLAFHWCNVPMPLTTLSVEDANSIGQTPQADVYAQIEKDCKEAINVLPERQSGDAYGRVNKGIARAILGRLYLAQERWADAAAIYKAIIDSGVYSLYRGAGDQSYAKLFGVGAEYSEEPIFFAMNMKDKLTNVHTIYKTPECNGGWHQFAINNELVDAYFCSDGKTIDKSPLYDDNDPYANRDPRLYATIFLPPVGTYPGTVYEGVTYDCFNENRNDRYDKYARFNGLCAFKGLDEDMPSIWDNYVYTPFIRYAEVLLSYIEALNESAPGSVTQAVIDQTINDIRDRAGIPGIQKADFSSQEALRQAIRQERRVELALEGQRYFDVLRWGTAKEELNHYFTGVKLSTNPADHNYGGNSPVDERGYYKYENRTWADHNRYFPIPQNDRNVNPNLTQNPGYN